jgi:hypothetical protein
MRWRTSRGGDPRFLDLLAIVALIIVIVGAWRYLADSSATPPSSTAFIVPSQSVRW